MRNFRDKTPQESETLITRRQEGFGAGAFDDIPGSRIPIDGVKYSNNYHLHSDRAEPRRGSRQWGKWSTSTAHAALPSLSGRTGYSLTKSGTTVTKTVGASFTSDDVGNYVVYDDGARERIEAFISSTQVTVAVSTAHAASTAAYIMGPVNCIRQHKRSGKIVLHIDTRVFVSDDVYMSNWHECHNITPEYALDSSVSMWDEEQNYAFFYNSGGVYRVDLSDTTDLTNNPPLYFKINTPVPTVTLSDNTEVEDGYARKYLYGMIRLSGDGNTRNRNTSGVVIEQISGPVEVDSNFKDYGKVWTTLAFGPDDALALTESALIEPLTMPVNPSTFNTVGHWTHYALFATLDVGPSGIDANTGRGNNDNLFVWVADVPVAKAFVCGRSGNTVTASAGTFSEGDVGSFLSFQGLGAEEIFSYISSSVVTTVNSGTITSRAACIGLGRVLTASQTGTTITRTAGETFSVNDVGKQVFWANGKRSVITAYTDPNTVTAYPSQSVSSTGATLDPLQRKFNDTTTDDTLKDRIGGYSLQNRFFKPLPDCNMGVLAGTFMYVAVRGENKVYYSQIPLNEIYRAGYYNESLQLVIFKDVIRLLREFPDRLIVYCANSTHGVPTNIVDTEEVPEVGEVVGVVSGQFIIDHHIGLLDYGSVQSITHGRDRIITNELAVRDFDGTAYSETDYAHDRIRKKLIKLEAATASAYHKEAGYIIWGLEE